jgi:DNA polymerase III sliding clamp (beta) subunit (PCNA family)
MKIAGPARDLAKPANAAAAASAISNEETKYYLCSVSLKFLNERLIATATDGHRLIKTSIAAPANSDFLVHSVIVPSDACAAIAKLNGCAIRIGTNIIEAKTEDRLFAHKLIDLSRITIIHLPIISATQQVIRGKAIRQ